MVVAFRRKEVYHAAQFLVPFPQVELAMFVRVLRGFPLILGFVCTVLLPSATYARGTHDVTYDRALSSSSSWRAHAILAETYLQQGLMEEAIKEAERALDLGQGKAAAVQPLLARALADHGDKERAIGILQAYLKDHRADVEASILLDSLQPSSSTGEYGGALPSPKGKMAPALAPVTPSHLHSSWLPPEVDEKVPAVEPDAACALDDVLQETGKRVKEFVSNVDRFTATESLEHETINKAGIASRPQTRKFEYLVSVGEYRPGLFSVEEFRNNRGSVAEFPDGVATKGLPTMVLIFHPYNVLNFEMRCEGLARWNGALAWQMHFRQRSDKPNTTRAYKIGTNVYPVPVKGRAWIDADSYQILRLETNLIAPIPQIRLREDRTVIEYGPVHFQEGKVNMWLPQNADVYYDWNGRRSHRRHSFSNYLLFSVTDKPRISAPNAAELELFELLNQERSAQGLPTLQWDVALFRAAREHALLMFKLNTFEHQLPGEPTLEERIAAAGARFSYIAENVAIGADAQSIHSGWMNSPGHRKNILNSRVTAVGIAVAGGNGGFFAVQDFSQSSSDLTLEQQEKQVVSLLKGRGLHVTSGSQDDRKACYSNFAGPRSRTGSVMASWSVLRFESTDLSVLPPEVDKQIRSAPYSNVAVGACDASNSSDLPQYSIALVLY